MSTPTNPDIAEQVKLAAEAFIYGYPLVYNMHEMAKFPSGPNLGSPEPVPYNRFGYARHLLTPEAHFVSQNNDSMYIIAVCDVRSGPLVLHVPDTHDRYYVLQFVDAWTNNFAYIGRRATGTQEASYVLAPHGYTGAVPAGMQLIQAPTGLFVIVGRLTVNGEADLQVVHALQDQFTITPVNVNHGGTMLGVALAGLVANVSVYTILRRGNQQNLNVSAARQHVMGDLLGSIGALLAAGIILTTGWTPIDPILSVLVAVLILRSAWSLLRKSNSILMEEAPDSVDPRCIAQGADGERARRA